MLFKEIDFKKIATDIADNTNVMFTKDYIVLIARIHEALTNVSIQRIDESVDAFDILKKAIKQR